MLCKTSKRTQLIDVTIDYLELYAGVHSCEPTLRHACIKTSKINQLIEVRTTKTSAPQWHIISLDQIVRHTFFEPPPIIARNP